MSDLLVDSDIFIDHLRGARELRVQRHSIYYSAITRCELFSGTDDETHLRQLLAPFGEIEVDRPVAELAGQLRRKGRIRTPDALIAATALVHGLVLVTRNRRDFEPVDGLTVTAEI